MRTIALFLFAATLVARGADSAEPKVEGTWKWTFNMSDGTKAEPKARIKREAGVLAGTSIPRPGMSLMSTSVVRNFALPLSLSLFLPSNSSLTVLSERN